MKFLHMADLHLGKSLGEFDLKEDQRYILQQMADIAEEKQVDAVLIAGDVFDKTIPSEAAVQLLDDFLHTLSEKRIAVYMISGNHDSDERLNFGSRLFEEKQVYISAKFDGTLRRYTQKDAYGEVNIYLMPFVKASQVKRYYPDAEIDSYDAAVKTVLANTALDTSKRNLLVAHQFVAGKSEMPQLAGSEGAAVKNVGDVERIGYESLLEFDYVALGHIHSAQSVGSTNIRYAGSPLKYSLSEWMHEKTVSLITLEEKGSVKIEAIPLVPKRDLRHIKGKMDVLFQQERIETPEDFLYITLTDETCIDNVMNIARQYYPNTVKLEYERISDAQQETLDLTSLTGKQSFEAMFADFYRQIYEEALSEEERCVIKKLAEEVGLE